jgi:hypothetical protein
VHSFVRDIHRHSVAIKQKGEAVVEDQPAKLKFSSVEERTLRNREKNRALAESRSQPGRKRHTAKFVSTRSLPRSKEDTYDRD